MNEALRKRVAKRAGARCEYCLYPEAFSLVPHQLDHVIPRQHGGEDGADNLAFSCATCNRVKGPNLASIDPETKQITPLFHPRTQAWQEHFGLEDVRIVGLTPEGRATVSLLKLNDEMRLRERRMLLAREQLIDSSES